MTREEAIQYLIDTGISPEHIMELVEALEQEPCTDAISRQAVLDLAKFDGRKNLGSIIHAFDVEQLPPVTPVEKQEPCGDAISRQAMQTELKNCEVVDVRDEDDDLVGYYNADTVDSIVRNLPPVTPAEKVGQWIEQIDHEENCRTLICSNCDRPALHDGDSIWKHKFCPHCGAKMQEVEE